MFRPRSMRKCSAHLKACYKLELWKQHNVVPWFKKGFIFALWEDKRVKVLLLSHSTKPATLVMLLPSHQHPGGALHSSGLYLPLFSTQKGSGGNLLDSPYLWLEKELTFWERDWALLSATCHFLSPFFHWNLPLFPPSCGSWSTCSWDDSLNIATEKWKGKNKTGRQCRMLLTTCPVFCISVLGDQASQINCLHGEERFYLII